MMSSVSYTHLDVYKRQVFSFVAKNANASQADEFESIIENTLKEVVKTGINKEALLAGINSSEFKDVYKRQRLQRVSHR